MIAMNKGEGRGGERRLPTWQTKAWERREEKKEILEQMELNLVNAALCIFPNGT